MDRFENNIVSLGDGLGFGALLTCAIQFGGVFVLCAAIAAFGVYIRIRNTIRAVKAAQE